MNHSNPQNLALLILRLIIASIFIYAGYGKFQFWSDNPFNLGSFDLNMMKFLSVAEPLGALALILGIFTRLAATCLAIILAGAIYYCLAVYKIGFFPTGTAGWSFPLAILGGCIILMAFGAGGLSVDAVRRRR